ncbi:unnamed protein product [Pedinophyceae sp. YPF-701]|nr:unnamed protein product [Pedinophyceae sp. YPF-701]
MSAETSDDEPRADEEGGVLGGGNAVRPQRARHPGLNNELHVRTSDDLPVMRLSGSRTLNGSVQSRAEPGDLLPSAAECPTPGHSIDVHALPGKSASMGAAGRLRFIVEHNQPLEAEEEMLSDITSESSEDDDVVPEMADLRTVVRRHAPLPSSVAESLPDPEAFPESTITGAGTMHRGAALMGNAGFMRTLTCRLGPPPMFAEPTADVRPSGNLDRQHDAEPSQGVQPPPPSAAEGFDAGNQFLGPAPSLSRPPLPSASGGITPAGSSTQHDIASQLFIPPECLEVDLNRPLGQGGYGVVYKALYRKRPASHPREVAVKVFKDTVHNRALRDEISQFLDVALGCSNVARLHGFTEFPPNGDGALKGYGIVMHFYPTTLRHYIEEAAPFPPTEVVRIALEICQGLDDLHSTLEVAHGDLKPRNVLLDHKKGTHISDFGTTQIVGLASGRVDGYTPGYCAPEQAQPVGELTTASDMWCVGYIIVECLTGRRSWIRPERRPRTPSDVDMSVGTPVQAAIPDIPKGTHPQLKSILQRCFKLSPAERITARQAADELELLLRELQSVPKLHLPPHLSQELRAFWQDRVSNERDQVPWSRFRQAVLDLATDSVTLGSVLRAANESVAQALAARGIDLRGGQSTHPFVDIVVKETLDPAGQGHVEATQMYALMMECKRLTKQQQAEAKRAGARSGSHRLVDTGHTGPPTPSPRSGTSRPYTTVHGCMRILADNWQSIHSTLLDKYRQVNMETLDRVLDTTAFQSSQLRMRTASAALFPGTRDWLFAEMDRWLATPPVSARDRIMVVTGKAGTGKTTAGAAMCQRERNVVKAYHFCQKKSIVACSAAKIVKSIAFQLACSVPGCYEPIQDAAESLPEDGSPLDLFSFLIDAPLRALEAATSEVIVVLIDGVDECPEDERSHILGLNWWSLPDCVRVIFMGRQQMLPTLRGRCRVVDLSTYVAQVHEDLQRYCTHQLAGRMADVELPRGVDYLVRQSDQSFLYAQSIVQQIRLRDQWTEAELRRLPSNLEHVLEESLMRVYDGVDTATQARIEQVLEVVVATFEPVSIEEMGDLILHKHEDGNWEPCGTSDLVTAIARLDELVTENARNDNCVTFQHQWMTEWLLARGSVKPQRFNSTSRGTGTHSGAAAGTPTRFESEVHTLMCERCFFLVQRNSSIDALLDEQEVDLGPAHLYTVRYFLRHLSIAIDIDIRDSGKDSGAMTSPDVLTGLVSIFSGMVTNMLYCRAQFEAHRGQDFITEAVSITQKLVDAISRDRTIEPDLSRALLANLSNAREMALFLSTSICDPASSRHIFQAAWSAPVRSFPARKAREIARMTGFPPHFNSWLVEQDPLPFRPIIGTLLGYNLPMLAVAVAMDGSVVAGIACDCEMKVADPRVLVWGAGDGRVKGVLEAPQGCIMTTVAMSGMGEVILAGTVTGEVLVWDCRGMPKWTSARRTPLKHGKPVVLSLQVEPEDMPTSRASHLSEGGKGDDPVACSVTAVCIDLAGRRFAAGADDHNIRVWEMAATAGDGASIMGPMVLKVHSAMVTCLSMTRNGMFLCSGGADGRVKLFPLGALGVRPKELPQAIHITRTVKAGVGIGVRSVSVRLRIAGGRHQQQVLVCCGTEGYVQVWDALGANGPVCLRRLLLSEGVCQFCFISQDSSALVASYTSHGRWFVAAFDANEGRRIQEYSAMNQSCCSASGDARLVVTGTPGGSAHVWDFQAIASEATDAPLLRPAVNGREQAPATLADHALLLGRVPLAGHAAPIRGVAIGGGGRVIVTICEDGVLFAWADTGGGSYGAAAKAQPHLDVAQSVTISGGGDTFTIAIGYSNRRVAALLLTNNGEGYWQLSKLVDFEAHVEAVRCVALSSDSQFLTSATGAGSLVLWGLEKPSKPRRVQIIKHQHPVCCCALLRVREEELWLLFGSEGGACNALQFDVGHGDTQALASERRMPHGLEVRTCALTMPGGRLLAVTGCQDRRVRVWDVLKERTLQVLDAHDGWVLSCSVAYDGKLLATGGADRTCRVWRWTGGTHGSYQLLTEHQSACPVTCCAIGPPGSPVAYVSRQTAVQVRDPTKDMEESAIDELSGPSAAMRPLGISFTAPLPRVPGAALADDSVERGLVVSGDARGAVCFWSLAKGLRVGRIKDAHASTIICTVVSGDGLVAVFGSLDGAVSRVSLTKHAIDCMLGRHSGAVLSCSTDTTGQVCVSGGADGYVRMWRGATEVFQSPQQGGMVIDVSVSLDGSTLLSCTDRGAISVWNWRGTSAAIWRATGIAPHVSSLLSRRWAGVPVTSIPPLDEPTAVTLSSDGRIAGVCCSSGVLLWDLQSALRLNLETPLPGSLVIIDRWPCASNASQRAPTLLSRLASYCKRRNAQDDPREEGDAYWVVSLDGGMLHILRLSESEPGSCYWHSEAWQMCTGQTDVDWIEAGMQSCDPLLLVAIDSEHRVRRLSLMFYDDVDSDDTDDERFLQPAPTSTTVLQEGNDRLRPLSVLVPSHGGMGMSMTGTGSGAAAWDVRNMFGTLSGGPGTSRGHARSVSGGRGRSSHAGIASQLASGHSRRNARQHWNSGDLDTDMSTHGGYSSHHLRPYKRSRHRSGIEPTPSWQFTVTIDGTTLLVAAGLTATALAATAAISYMRASGRR